MAQPKAEKAVPWMWQRLVTKEDPGHVHKVLGCLALLSFAWRLVVVSFIGADDDADMGFASHPQWTIPTLALHLALSWSSFFFTIPPQRIKTDGGRIWPEYRLHSSIFATRSLACIAVNAYHQHFHHQGQQEQPANTTTEPTFTYWINWIIVLACMAAADVASYSVGKYHSPSVRELRAPPAAKYFFSVMQFFATAAHLVAWKRRRSSMYFYIVMVIQVSAFLLTLRRRHVVPHVFNLIAYGLLLVGGMATGLYECLLQSHAADCPPLTAAAVVGLTACTAALWRLGPWWPPRLRNKYLVWTGVYLALDRIWRPVLDDNRDTTLLTPRQLITMAWVALGLVAALGVYKVQFDSYSPTNKKPP